MILAVRTGLALFLLVGWFGAALGHALEPGYLDVRQMTPDTWQVFFRKPDVNGAPMAIDARLPEGCTPATGPAPQSDGAAWISGWVAACPGGLAGRTISIPGLSAQRTDVLLRLQRLEGNSATARLTPDRPEYRVPVDPTTWSVLVSYTLLGFEHILEGWDHLLFVFALLVLIRDPWRLVAAITAFTLAHSITLALAALGHLSIPGPPVEATIALSIVFLAVEILKREEGNHRLSERFPWAISFTFGLLHGLGFAGALSEIGLPEGDIPAALLAFNVGVELGQLTFVAGVLIFVGLVRAIWQPAIAWFRNPRAPGAIGMGYVIGSVATYWLVERVTAF